MSKNYQKPSYIALVIFISVCACLIFGIFETVIKARDSYFTLAVLLLPALGKGLKFPKAAWVIGIVVSIGVLFYFFWVIHEVVSISPVDTSNQQVISTSKVLTLSQIKNASYNDTGFAGDNFKLTNGLYNLPYPKGESQQDYFIKFDSAAYGDVNSDGTIDAAAILDSRSGGTGDGVSLEILVNHGGQPVWVASKYLGDRTQVNSLTVQSNQIVLSITPWNGGYGIPQVLKYRLQNNKLVSS